MKLATTTTEMRDPQARGVLFAPDSFGGWLSAPEVARMVQGMLDDDGLTVSSHPMADGGEGTLDALLAHRPGVLRHVAVPGPLRESRIGAFACVAGATVVESATATGRRPRDAQRPLEASSFGLGVLLCAAAKRRRGRLVVGLGGSATADGGLGALQALGLRAFASDGTRLTAGAGASQLSRVHRIEGEPEDIGALEVWCDVHTSLLDSAARFGPQKGLTTDQIDQVTQGLAQLADALDAWRRRRGRPPLLRTLAGGGAAGGLGYALAAVDAQLLSGARAVADHTQLDAALDHAHTVIIGEGRLDSTSFDGKVADTVVARARARGCRVLALAGAAHDVPAPPIGPDAVVVSGEEPDRRQGMANACKRIAVLLNQPAD